MRTFQQFVEATESDVKAMGGTDAQIAALKKRQEKRGYGFQSNDERNSSAPAKTQSSTLTGTKEKPTIKRPESKPSTTNKGSVKTVSPGTGVIGTKERTPVERQAPKPSWNKGSGEGYPKAKNTGALATTPKPKSSALATTPKPKSSALATTKPTAKPQSRGGAITKSTSQLAKSPKGGELAKTREVTPASGGQKPNRQPKTYRDINKTPSPTKKQIKKSDEQRNRILKNSKLPGEKRGMRNIGKGIRKGAVLAKSIGKQTQSNKAVQKAKLTLFRVLLRLSEVSAPK
jgi:hypothetical protein